MTYKERIIYALEQLNGHAYLTDIYKIFKEISHNETLPKSYKAIIRATLERNSSDSAVFEGSDDLFYSVEGIGNGHWGLKNFDNFNSIELTQEDDEFCEGKLLLKKHLYRERNPIIISKSKNAFLKEHGYLYCEICGFNFKDKYGDLGEDFIEAHHIKPVSQMSDGEKTKITDIVMVCSNCHSMIHRKKPWLTKDKLKTLIKK